VLHAEVPIAPEGTRGLTVCGETGKGWNKLEGEGCAAGSGVSLGDTLNGMRFRPTVNCFVSCILRARTDYIAEHQPSGVAYRRTGHPQTRQIGIVTRVAGGPPVKWHTDHQRSEWIVICSPATVNSVNLYLYEVLEVSGKFGVYIINEYRATGEVR
jgi:hypothetical protein